MSKEGLSPNDPSSFSRPEQVKVVHIHLDLDVDFSTHILKGCAKVELERYDPSAKSVVSINVIKTSATDENVTEM